MPSTGAAVPSRMVRIVLVVLALLVLFGIAWGVYKLVYSPNVSQPPKALTIDQQLDLQTLLMEKHDYNQVLSQTTTLLKKLPNSVELWLYKGISEFYLSKDAEAKVSFEKVISLDPPNKPAAYYLNILNLSASKDVSQVDITSKDEFEAFIGLPMPSGVEFMQSEKRPFDQSRYTEYYWASYKITGSAKEIVNFFETEFNKRKGEYTYSRNKIGDTEIIFASSNYLDISIGINSVAGKISLDVSKKR